MQGGQPKKVNIILALFFGILISLLSSQQSFAARPDSLKDVLSDSRPSTASNHTITLDLATGTQFVATSNETITVTFPAGFDLSSIAIGDVDFINNGTDETLQSGACGATDTVRWQLSSQTMTFTACNSYTAETAGTSIVIKVGTNAAGGSNRVVNTTAGSHTMTVAGTYGDDSQDTVLVITTGVTVSATIDETLTNTIAAVASGSCTVSGGTSDDSTATTIPFGLSSSGVISTEAFYNVCQRLTVATNAAGGYTVTVYTVAGLDSGANAFPVGSCDGSCNLTTPSTWATATNNGYAICMDDTTGDGAETASDWDSGDNEQCGEASQKFELVADLSGSQTPSTIMSSAAGVTDVSFIGWRISADATQAAGTYTGTADYITTSTF